MKLKYSNSKLLPFLILVAVFLSSCFKDKEIFEPYPENPWSNLPKTELNVNGEVVDEKGIAIQDVLITAANVSAVTDKNGVFVIKNSLQPVDFIYVKAEKKGYFNGARVIRGNKNGQNIVRIILMEQKKVASISSSKGAEINVQGLKIKFPANGYVDANGKSYSGNINVAAKYLDPEDIQTLLKMPGDLRAVDFQGKEKFLESFGMAAVELTDPTGNKLNLGNGGEAELSFPQPKLATAPAKMPLWHFDEKIGAWREEGEANLINNRYVGKVKHFSYWNCDFPYDRVFAKGRIVDQNGNSLAGVFVGLDLVGSWMGGHGQTDANGVFLGCIPKGKELELKVRGIADSCSTVLLVKNVGSFNSDVDFGDIVINVPTTGSYPVKYFKGTVFDCSGSPLINGYISVRLLNNQGGYRYVNLFTDALGAYKYTITPSRCQSDVTSVIVTAYDFINKKESLAKTFSINAGTNDLGTIDVCSSLTEFIDFKFGDSTFYTIVPRTEIGMMKDSLKQNDILTMFFAAQNTQSKFLQLQIEVSSDPPTAGTYAAKYIYGLGLFANGTAGPSNQNLSVNLTEVNYVSGGYLAGSISGTMTVQGGQAIVVSGSFRVKKF